MQKIAAIGIDTFKDEFISGLIDLEVVQLTDESSRLSEDFSPLNMKKGGGLEDVQYYEAKIARAGRALEVIEQYGGLKKLLIKTRRAIPDERRLRIETKEAKIENEVERLIDLRESIKRTVEGINKVNLDTIMLSPWENHDVPLEITGTNTTDIMRFVIPINSDLNELKAALSDITELYGIEETNCDNDMRYITLIVSKSVSKDVSEILDTFGMQELDFSSFKGTAAENLEKNKIKIEKLNEELQNIETEIKSIASLKEEIENYSDILTIEADKSMAKSKLFRTKRTFYLEGWIPERRVKELDKLIEGKECYYEVRDPDEGEDVPVQLKNNRFFTPIETITEMYSLPAYGSFDPTSIYALFYICFFGMMFSDAGYGILMAAACLTALKKFDLEGNVKKMVTGFMYCGISTAFWGVMYGGWFGDFFEVFARIALGKEFDIKPLWFDPLDDPLKLLVFSLGLGVLHIFVGMGIDAYNKIRRGEIADAVFDVGLWYVTLTAAIIWLGGGYIGNPIAEPAKNIFLAGLLGLFLTGGRNRKGFGKLVGGFSNVYSITSYMSDILSYARILALGLATGVISQVVNTMGSLYGAGFVGTVILLIVFAFGHTLNFAINVLGAFIHSSRLQYVEFFGKFYEDGGEAFMPLKRNTKYIRIENQIS